MARTKHTAGARIGIAVLLIVCLGVTFVTAKVKCAGGCFKCCRDGPIPGIPDCKAPCGVPPFSSPLVKEGGTCGECRDNVVKECESGGWDCSGCSNACPINQENVA